MSDNQASASVETALAHALRLQASDPQLAAEQARQVLLAAPRDPVARLVLGMSHNALGEHAQALALLQPLAAEQPEAPRVQLELGIALAALARAREAVAALETDGYYYPQRI